MAVPKRRVSKAKRDKRRASAWRLSAPTLVKCPECGEYKRTHIVCSSCGMYNKRQVIQKDA